MVNIVNIGKTCHQRTRLTMINHVSVVSTGLSLKTLKKGAPTGRGVALPRSGSVPSSNQAARAQLLTAGYTDLAITLRAVG